MRVKLDAALDFLKSLKGEAVEVGLSSLTVSCDALRAGEQTISLTVDPDHASALIAKAKAAPGVVAVGWTSGSMEMDRTIRFAAGDWRNGDQINKDKIANAVAGVLTKTLSAKSSTAAWDANTGKLKLTFKRPSQVLPALGLTETHRDHRAGIIRQTGQFRPPDAVGLEPRHLDGGRRHGSKAQSVRRLQRRRGRRRTQGRQRLGRRAR